MPYVTVGQENSATIDLYYEDHGKGPPVVLIHGFPLSGASWEKQLPALLDSGHRVVTYDRRGFGQSSKPTSGYDYETFTDDLDKLMTKLDLRDATLVGFSMGTGEVTHYLGTHGSDRVSKIVLIGSLPPFLLKTADNPGGVEASIFDGIRAGIVADRLLAMEQFLINLYNFDVYKGKRVSEPAFRASWNVAAGASPRATLDCVQTWLTDFRKDLPAIRVPTLLIHGDADRILPIAATAIPLQKAIKGSRLVVAEGAPHGLIWTHAERVNRELTGFLAQAKAAAA